MYLASKQSLPSSSVPLCIDCGWTCVDGCKGDCTGFCTGTCKGTFSGSCIGGCQQTCYGLSINLPRYS